MGQYVGMDGRAYLEKVIGDRLGSIRGLPDASRTSSLNLPELEGIATGLVAAGALAQSDAEKLLGDLHKTMARPSAVHPPKNNLLRVISLAGRTFTQGTVPTTLISLELWSTMLVLRTAVQANDDDWDHETAVKFWDARSRWRAWDDTGTEYRTTTSTATNADDIQIESRIFYPGPPEEARFLTLVVEHPEHQAQLELPLI